VPAAAAPPPAAPPPAATRLASRSYGRRAVSSAATDTYTCSAWRAPACVGTPARTTATPASTPPFTDSSVSARRTAVALKLALCSDDVTHAAHAPRGAPATSLQRTSASPPVAHACGAHAPPPASQHAHACLPLASTSNAKARAELAQPSRPPRRVPRRAARPARATEGVLSPWREGGNEGGVP
jgi:hypothetical protein